jgi:nicotinamidase-related amidase
MPITALDEKTALVVIDLQKGIIGLPTVHPSGDVVARSAQLARAFRARGWPVVLVNVTGVQPHRAEAAAPKLSPASDWSELAPELDAGPEDILIHKRTWGAFIGTALHDELSRRGVTQIVLTGIATSIGVESTARSAYDHGYNVAFVVDAMTDRDAEAHRHRIEKTFSRLGEMDTTDNVLRLLEPPASHQ